MRKSAINVLVLSIWKATDDKIPSLLIKVYGLNLKELDLFFSLVLYLALLDCLFEESFGITYIMHAHKLAKLNKVANLVLSSINYHLLYRIVISI